jgi:DNA-binding transcriptional MerR regulator
VEYIQSNNAWRFIVENKITFIEQLGLESNLRLEDIPNIDLYMDQVIQLFEHTFSGNRRNEKDKILTKTMINNYAKGKLFFPIKNKKYSKEHLLLISFIFQLKGTITIQDIKLVLEKLNEKIVHEDFNLDELYEAYLELTEQSAGLLKGDIREMARKASELVLKLDDKDAEYLERLLLIISLSHMSNLYKRAAEKLVDQLQAEE